MKTAKFAQLASHIAPGGWTDEDSYESLRSLEIEAVPKPALEALEAVRAEVEAALNAPPVPRVVTPRQFRLALHHAGISAAQIAEIIDGNEAGQIEWEYATEVRRDHPLVAWLASELNLSSAQVDAIFVDAGSR